MSDTGTMTRDVPTSGHLPGSAGYRRVMAAMFAAGMATFVLLYDTQALLPELRSQFAVTPAQATLTLSLATAGLAAALLVIGPASERIGRTRLILAAVWSASLLALLCPLAPSWHALLGLRLLQGVALAGLPAVATAYLREELHPIAQARAAGLYIGGTALGGMVGRLLTAPIADAHGWRWAMAAAGLFALVCAVAVTVALPPSQRFRRRAPGRLGLATMSRAALADPALRALYLLGACAAGALVAVYNALGFRLTGGPHHLGLGTLSLVYLVYVLGTMSSVVSGRLADRFGRRAILPSGCALAIAGVLLTLLPWLPAIVVGLAGLTAGFFVIHGLASGWVAARAHLVGASASQAAAFYLCAYYAGSSVFGSLGSSAWGAAGWPGVTTLALLLLMATAWLARTLRRTPALAPVTYGDGESMTSELAQPVDPPRLFAYGTLAPGRPNAHVLDDVAGTWEPATTTGHLVHDGWGDALGFPALVLDHDATAVVPGMLLTADGLNNHWDDLDAFEGAAYQRVTIPITTADGTRRSAQAYVLRPRS